MTRFGGSEAVVEAAVTVSVATAVPFTWTDAGDTLQPMRVAEVLQERLTVPLNP
jgi:hypothetical protein